MDVVVFMADFVIFFSDFVFSVVFGVIVDVFIDGIDVHVVNVDFELASHDDSNKKSHFRLLCEKKKMDSEELKPKGNFSLSLNINSNFKTSTFVNLKKILKKIN